MIYYIMLGTLHGGIWREFKFNVILCMIKYYGVQLECVLCMFHVPGRNSKYFRFFV